MDHSKVEEFLGRFVADLGATEAAGLTVIGHRLGLYRALAEGPATPEEFAERTGYHLRYLTEWLRGQAAGGYVGYDAATGRFHLTAERPLPARRLRPRRPGGRAGDPRPDRRGGLHPLPPRRRDPVQRRLRDPPLAIPAAAPAPSRRATRRPGSGTAPRPHGRADGPRPGPCFHAVLTACPLAGGDVCVAASR